MNILVLLLKSLHATCAANVALEESTRCDLEYDMYTVDGVEHHVIKEVA